MTAVQVSDLHADRLGSCSQLLRDRVAEKIRVLAPDWIFATGDFITWPGDSIEDAVGWTANLKAKEGIFAVIGNHDNRYVIPVLKAKGIELLFNAWTMRNGIALSGVSDPSKGNCSPEQALGKIPQDLATIFLSHQPDTFWTYDRPVTLQLSGHTHGGQVTFFGMLPLPRLMPRFKRVVASTTGYEPMARRHFRETQRNAWSGFFHRPDGSTLYVNRGLGRFKRISIYCPPEITVWELVPAEKESPRRNSRDA
ncbi:metallophosphoesterase, partial [Singulisphaera rosea]